MRGTWPVEQPTLTDGVVLLRPWRPEDAEAVFRACQDPDVQHFTQVPVPYLLEHAAGFVADAPRQWADGTGAQFAVTDPTTGQLLGCMGLLEADRVRGRIGAGYWTAPWARSRGLTRRALRLATGWALGDGGFDVVVLEVELDNPRSMAVVRSVGYVPGDAPIDSWELKGLMRHFVGLQISRSELQGGADNAGARQVDPAPTGEDVISLLHALEPLGHRSPPGSTRVHFEDVLGDGFWEVGASGRVYDRMWCLDELADRYADRAYDPLLGITVDQFEARPLGNDVWLATYRLFQDERETRRLTVWRREGQRWVALYHQGTLVPSGGPVREPLLSDRLTRRQRVAWALAWSVCVAAAWATLVWATQDLVQWDNSGAAESAQFRARWIVLLACLVLAAAAVVAERIIGSRTGAVFAGGTAAAVLIMTWLPIPFGAFATAAASGYLLIAAIVAVLFTSMRT